MRIARWASGQLSSAAASSRPFGPTSGAPASGALTLDVHDRATLAERLLASLDDLSEDEADQLWADEAQRRLDEYRAGHAQAIPAKAVHDRAERLVR